MLPHSNSINTNNTKLWLKSRLIQQQPWLMLLRFLQTGRNDDVWQAATLCLLKFVVVVFVLLLQTSLLCLATTAANIGLSQQLLTCFAAFLLLELHAMPVGNNLLWKFSSKQLFSRFALAVVVLLKYCCCCTVF